MKSVSVDPTILLYAQELRFAGVACDLITNSLELRALLSQLSHVENCEPGNRFSMRIVVNESSFDPIEEPHFRGLRHVVTASFGTGNIFIFDVLRRTLSASISRVAAIDLRFWREKLIPISLGVLGAAMGLVPMHCACLERNGDGLLIAGLSGAGKSTLSVALAQNGFSYVSDDWTYMSRHQSSLVAFGTSAPVKLLPDATNHFPSLTSYCPHKSMNGELAYEVDIADAFSVRIERACEPRWVIFLERIPDFRVEFASVASSKARSYLNSSVERLPTELYEASAMRDLTLEMVSRLPCWLLRYGGTPQVAAEYLVEFVANQTREIFA
jgi:hypothetical protein